MFVYVAGEDVFAVLIFRDKIVFNALFLKIDVRVTIE